MLLRVVGGADLLSGPLDIAPCGAALGRRGRPRGPRAYQGAGGRPGGIGRQGRHRAGVWRRGGRRRVPSPRRADRAVAARVAIPGAAGGRWTPPIPGAGARRAPPCCRPRPYMGRVQCAETPGLQPFLAVVRGGQGSHGGPRVAHRHMVPRLGQKESPAEVGLPAAMSASLRIRSALPSGTDLPDGVADGPFVTRSGSRAT